MGDKRDNLKKKILEAFIQDGILQDDALTLNEYAEKHPEDNWEYDTLEECIADYYEEDVLQEAQLKGDQTREFQLGDIIFTNSYYSTTSRQTVTTSKNNPGTKGHKVIVITSKKDEDGVVHYRGFALTSKVSNSNKNGGFPNKLHVVNYSSILTKGNTDTRDSAVNINDLVKLNSKELSPTGTYKGHVSDEFLDFLQTAYKNYKSGKSNKNMIWDINNQWNRNKED